MAGGGVERSAVGILDAGIEVERSLFGTAGVVDAVRARERVDIFVVEIEIAGELAELRGFGDSAERIFRGDLREFQSGLHHAVEAVTGEVAGVGAGGTLAIEYAHADGA